MAASLAGPSPGTPRIGGRIDAWISVDGSALWKGLSLNVRPELVYGNSINRQGAREFAPLNLPLNFPSPNSEDFDLHVTVSQTIGKGRLTVGKINTIDLKRATPILGGGGIEGFQATQFAAPVTMITPPAIIGALFSAPAGKTMLTLGIWDPESAVNRSGFDQKLFRKGVSGMAVLTVPVSIGGRPGWQSFTVAGSSKRGVDLEDIPDLTVPLPPGATIGTRAGGFQAKWTFQHYLWTNPANPRQGWGLFGEVALWDANPTPLEWAMSLGITGNPLATRQRDRFGIGYYRIAPSGTLRDAVDPLIALTAEQGAEAYWQSQLAPHLSLTANVQWLDPALKAVDSSLFAGLRLTARF